MQINAITSKINLTFIFDRLWVLCCGLDKNKNHQNLGNCLQLLNALQRLTMGKIAFEQKMYEYYIKL